MYNIHYSVLVDLYEKVTIFELIDSRKLRGNVEDSFGLKLFLFCINTPDKSLT